MNKDRFGFKEFLEAQLTPFPTITRLLVAAKWRGKVSPAAINVDVATSDLRGNRQSMIHITLLNIP